MRGYLLVDATKCIACHTCELACAVAHSTAKSLAGAASEDPSPKSRVIVRALAQDLAGPFMCRHCEIPPCAEACPEDALSREGDLMSPVILDGETCVGAFKCVRRCPYRVIQADEDAGKGVKCDLCIERLARGVEPACADSCPTGAIVFVASETPFESVVSDQKYLVVTEASPVVFEIDEEACTACGLCRRRCPQQCIAGEKEVPHVIDASRCIKCGACAEACKFGAVGVSAPVKIIKSQL